jgi:hypothetical protein
MTVTAKVAAPAIYAATMWIVGVTLPNDPLQGLTYPAALRAFKALPAVRILFDNGAGSLPGFPFAGFEASFPRFPLPGTKATSFALGSGSFTWTTKARSRTSFSGNTSGGLGGLWTATPNYHWQAPKAGDAVVFTTPPLKSSTVAVGAGAVTAEIKAGAGDVDLQVGISEVRPDGHETFVQDGWLRASQRKLDAKKSTPLEPVISRRAADVAPLPKGRFTKVTVPLYYEGHAYRAGSRIRVTISSPVGDQPVWVFGDVPKSSVKVSVRDAALLLPVVPGIAVPTPLPACLGLRGEPCR